MNRVSIAASTLRGWKRALFTATIATAALVFSGSASALTITTSGTHNLPNHANFTGVININASNVTLNCEGKSINFTSSLANNCTVGTGRRCGIYVMSRNNVTIKNCIVSGGFYEGILVRNGTDVVIQDTLVTGAVASGIRAENTTRLGTSGVDLVSNHTGFDGWGLSDADIVYTWANLNETGFYLNGGFVSLFYGDTRAFNNEVGFQVVSVPINGGALLGGNVETPTLPFEVWAHDNEYEGVVLADSQSSMLFRTQVDHNNLAEHPAAAGISFVNAHNNLVWQSLAFQNIFCDMKQDWTSSSNMDFGDNDLGTACGQPLDTW